VPSETARKVIAALGQVLDAHPDAQAAVVEIMTGELIDATGPMVNATAELDAARKAREAAEGKAGKLQERVGEVLSELGERGAEMSTLRDELEAERAKIAYLSNRLEALTTNGSDKKSTTRKKVTASGK
jgi:peptidoglycan hydrolase CwlO-like protein